MNFNGVILLATVVLKTIVLLFDTAAILILWNAVGVHETFHAGTASFTQALTVAAAVSIFCNRQSQKIER